MKRLAIFLLLPSLARATPLGASAGPDQNATLRSDLATRVAAYGDQLAPAIASGGGAALAVCQESEGATSLIRAARLAADGSLLDDPPITVASNGSDMLEQPAVAYDASQGAFWVVWMAHNAGTLAAVEIDPLGMMGMHSFGITGVGGQPAIAGGATGALLVFDRSPAMGVAARLINGGVPSAADLLVGGAGSARPSVASGSAGWLVAWEQPVAGHATHDVGATLVSTAGALTPVGTLNSDAAAMSADHVTPQVGFGGGGFLVAWSDGRAGTQVWARAVSPAGVPAATDFAATATASTKSRPQVGWAGGHFLVAWEAGALWGRRVDAPATLVDGETLLESEPAGAVPLFAAASAPSAIAALGTGAFLAWSYADPGGRASGRDLLVDHFADVGLPPAKQLSDVAASGPASERSPRVAWNGQRFLAVWEDARDIAKFVSAGGATLPEGTDLWGQAFDRTGAKLGPPFAIVATYGDQRHPAVDALPGGDFLIAWVDTRKDAGGDVWPSQYFTALDAAANHSRVYVGRVSPSGTPLDGNGLKLGTSLAQLDRFPSVTADPADGRFLVSWDAHTDLGHDSVEFAALDANAQPLAPPSEIPFAAGGTRACGSRAAWNGAGWLMVFESPCAAFTANPETSSVMAMRVDKSGTADPALFTVATGKTEVAPAIASTGSATVVAWEEHATATLTTAGTIRVAAVDPASGKVTPQADPIAQLSLLSLRWPALATAGSGFVLAFADETGALVRGLRLAADGTPAPADRPNGGDPTAMAQLSTQPLAPPLAAAGQLLPDPSGPALAAGGDGQLLLAYAEDGGPSVGRVHVRLYAGKLEGDRCDPAGKGFGCADALCTRDPADAAAGVCCATACDGPCQVCTQNGCAGVPKSDPECAAVDCARLSTACRSYPPSAPAACVAFGECGASESTAACTQFQPAPDGKSCPLAGCTSAACAGGECVCGDAAKDYGPPRGAGGCDFGGGAPTGIALVLLALGLRRRFWWLLLAGCSGASGLSIDLALDDALLAETAKVRIVVKAGDGSFTVRAPSTSGATLVRNVDLDRDGAVEIVVDLEPQLALRRTTRLALDPPNGAARAVTVAAQALNRFGNPIGVSDLVPAMLPGSSLTLALKCTSGCAHATLAMLAMPLDPANSDNLRRTSFHAATALYASESLDRAVLALGDFGGAEAEVGPIANPESGRVVVLAPDAMGRSLQAERQLTGANGDRLGAAAALGDADGDGQLDLVLGAPGAMAGRGRVYLISALAKLSATPDLSKLPQLTGAPGEALGSALAIVDGKIIAGAPGSGSIYALAGAPLAIAGSAVAPPGSQLGRFLDGIDGVIAAAAPGSGKVYLTAPSELTGGEPARAFDAPWPIGSLALVDIEADGVPELALAPAAGVEEVGVYDLPSGGAPSLRCAIHGAAGLGLGAVQRASGRFGDSLSLGAAGAGFLLAGAAIDAAGSALPLALDGALATFTAIPPSGAIARLTANQLLPNLPPQLLAADAQGQLYLVGAGP